MIKNTHRATPILEEMIKIFMAGNGITKQSFYDSAVLSMLNKYRGYKIDGEWINTPLDIRLTVTGQHTNTAGEARIKEDDK